MWQPRLLYLPILGPDFHAGGDAGWLPHGAFCLSLSITIQMAASFKQEHE